MRTKVALLLSLFLCCSIFAVDQKQIDEFANALKRACENKDIDAIKKPYYMEGASGPLLDEAIHTWEVWLLDYAPKQNWTVSAVEYYPKDEYLARADVNKQALADVIEPTTLNGHIYGPNLQVIGFVSVKFKQPSGGMMGRLNPVGIAPDGTLKIVSKKQM